jgi:phage terminase large subunit
VADGLQAGRETINKARFADTANVLAGIEGLKNYRRDWDDERKTFREIPVKDWAEHIGSAFRYLSLAWRDVVPPVEKPKKPDQLIYTAQPDGSVVGNMDVRRAVEAMVKRRRNRE